MIVIENTELDQAEIDRLASLGEPVTLRECSAEGVDLGGLDLPGWVFDRCDLREGRCRTAGLGRSRWISCKLSGADFTRADLADAVFECCTVTNVKFQGAKLRGCGFDACRLTGADFNQCRAFDVHFSESNLAFALLPGFSFRKARLVGVNLADADLTDCDFRGAELERCNLSGAILDKARFDDADLRSCDISGLSAAGIGRFRNARISVDQAVVIAQGLGLKVG